MVGAGLVLSLQTTGVNSGKYELDLDYSAVGSLYSLYLGDQLTASRIRVNSGLGL